MAATAAPVTAQPAAPSQVPAPGPVPQVRASDLTGRSFAGLIVSAGAQPGNITISASRAWAWTEPNPQPVAPGTAGETSRLYLEGDVRVDLGLYRFVAARAVVWLEQAGVSDEDPSLPVHQVAVYFDRVDDPVAEAGISQHADRLMVTGMLAGRLSLRADLLRAGRPAEGLILEGEQRMLRLQRSVIGAGAPPDGLPGPVERGAPEGPIRPGQSRPFEPTPAAARGESAVPPRSLLPPVDQPAPIFAREGVITFAGGDPVLMTAPGEDALVITGGVTVQYTDARRAENLIITAERCVAFLEQGTVAGLETRAQVSKVRGIYVEGDAMATNGRYTLRSPRIYYDVERDAAVAVDAVFWTYDERIAAPLYVRARAIRQEARNRFSATGAELTNSSFADPTFAIGASAVTIMPRPGGDDGPSSVRVEAENVYARAGPLPVFYWPWFKGDIDENFPLQQVAFGSTDSGGFTVRTGWDLFGLLGLDPPGGMSAKLLVDGYTRRGAALGGELAWGSETAGGRFFSYGIIEDNGTDHLPSGARIEHEDQTRGLFLAEHRWTIDESWTLFLEGSYAGDPTFVPAFFRDWGGTMREFTNAAYLRHLDGNTSLTFLGKGEFMDFTPNEYLLQSLGYNTDRLPEITYTRLADDLLAGISPGLFSYSSEYRFSRLRLNFTEPTAAELGFDTVRRAQAALGLLPNQSPADRLRARGLTESDLTRFDTRHEVSAAADWGPFRVMPFVTGRFTAYDKDFTAYSPDSDEQMRWWGAAGVRASTSFYTVDDAVESATWDLHRLRHIVEPSVTFWTAGSHVDQNDLPVYDDEVESIASGTAVRVGVASTWQTQRGGEGRWRSVDFLKVSVDGTFASNDADKESPVGRFFDYRPEYSLLGDFVAATAVWQVTDAVALTARENFDLEKNQPAHTVLGIRFDHSPDFSLYAEMRAVNERDITLVNGGARYQLTRHYAVGLDTAYDTDRGEFQYYGASVQRRFTGGTLGVRFTYDNIAGDYGVGVEFQPQGSQARGDILARLQRDSY